VYVLFDTILETLLNIYMSILHQNMYSCSNAYAFWWNSRTASFCIVLCSSASAEKILASKNTLNTLRWFQSFFFTQTNILWFCTRLQISSRII